MLVQARRSFLGCLQDFFNFFYQLSSRKWRRKDIKPGQVNAISNG